MKKLFLTLGISIAVVLGTMGTALAWAGDTTADGVSRCSQVAGRTTVTYTIHQNERAQSHDNTIITDSNFAGLAVGDHVSEGTTGTVTLPNSDFPFTLALKVTYPGEDGDNGHFAVPANTVYAAEDCTPPPPPVRLRPRADLVGPCGDPMYRARFDNTASTGKVRFRFSYLPYGLKTRVVVIRTLGAGSAIQTGYKHVQGGSLMVVKALGRVLVRQRSAPGGSYGACR